MVEGGHHPKNRPPTLGTTSVDFYHYPVTVWAYSTPHPQGEVLQVALCKSWLKPFETQLGQNLNVMIGSSLCVLNYIQ